jgi:hypothetical protein
VSDQEKRTSETNINQEVKLAVGLKVADFRVMSNKFCKKDANYLARVEFGLQTKARKLQSFIFVTGRRNSLIQTLACQTRVFLLKGPLVLIFLILPVVVATADELDDAARAIRAGLERRHFESADAFFKAFSLRDLFSQYGLEQNPPKDELIAENPELVRAILRREVIKQKHRQKIFEYYEQVLVAAVTGFLQETSSKLTLADFSRLNEMLSTQPSDLGVTTDRFVGPQLDAQRAVAQHFFATNPSADDWVRFFSYHMSWQNTLGQQYRLRILEENFIEFIKSRGLGKIHIIDLLGLEPSGRSYTKTWYYSKLAFLSEALEIPFFRTTRERDSIRQRCAVRECRIEFSLLPTRLAEMFNEDHLNRLFRLSYEDGSGTWMGQAYDAVKAPEAPLSEQPISYHPDIQPGSSDERFIRYVLSNPRIGRMDGAMLSRHRRVILSLLHDLNELGYPLILPEKKSKSFVDAAGMTSIGVSVHNEGDGSHRILVNQQDICRYMLREMGT